MNDDLIFLASSSRSHCTMGIDKHVEGYSTIQLMVEGGIELAYDDRWYLLEGVWFWPAHPGPRIRFDLAPGHPFWFHRHLAFRGPLFNRWVASRLWPQEPQPAPPGKDWGVFFDEMVAHSKGSGHWSQLQAINHLEHLLLALAQARTAAPVREAWLEQVIEWVAPPAQGDEADPPDYAHIASDLGMSLATLRRRFKHAMGTTLHAYVLQGRIAHARALLDETDLPIKRIAARLGYNNVYFFGRQFRQQAGVSPGMYRKSRQS